MRLVATTASLLCLAFAGPGCVTRSMWEAYRDARCRSGPSKRPGAGPERVLAAVRTGDGVYHLWTRYEDGSRRHHVFDPAAPKLREEGPGSWPSPGARSAGSLPPLRRAEGPFPRGGVPVLVERPQGTGSGGSEGRTRDRPLLRRRGRLLQLRQDGSGFRALGRFPRDPDVIEHPHVSAGRVTLGLLLTAATPLSLAADGVVIVGGTALFTASLPVLVPLLLADPPLP